MLCMGELHEGLRMSPGICVVDDDVIQGGPSSMQTGSLMFETRV